MTRCRHTLEDAPTGLACQRELGHPDGHTYAASSGSDLSDRRVEE